MNLTNLGVVGLGCLGFCANLESCVQEGVGSFAGFGGSGVLGVFQDRTWADISGVFRVRDGSWELRVSEDSWYKHMTRHFYYGQRCDTCIPLYGLKST